MSQEPLDEDRDLVNAVGVHHMYDLQRRLALRSAQVRRITNACDDIRPDPELRGAISVAVLRDLLDGRTP